MKILHITSELDGGGIERLLYNYSLYIPKDCRFDYAICSESEGILEKKCIEAGSYIFRYPKIRNGVIKTIKSLKKIIRDGNYDIVHVHASYKSFVALFSAFLAGVKVRIAHSHTCNESENIGKTIKRKICTMLTKWMATDLFSCGEEAGKWVWGEKAFANGKVYVMRNAIVMSDYVYNEEKRKKIRDTLHLTDRFVIGNVGRLSQQKNQRFLISAFEKIVSERKEAVLVLVGNGEDAEEIKKMVGDKNLQNSVLFLGVREDVTDLLNAFDLFVLPSLYEGLPVSMVEAQANGLSAFVSDRVTQEILINPNVKSLPLDENTWAESIVHFKESSRFLDSRNVCNSGYDIEKATASLEQYYLKCVGRI